MAGATVVVGAIVVLPLLAIVTRSLQVGDGWSLAHWTSLGSATAGTSLAVSAPGAVVSSLRAALPATAAALALGVPAAVAASRRPDGAAERLLLLPIAISATTIGLGLVLVAGRPPFDLRRSPALVVLAQMLVAIPLVVRTVTPALRSTPSAMLEAAALAGASPRRRWRSVQYPLISPAIRAAAGLACAVALGEFGATVFVARTGSPTLPIAIERLLSRPGEAGMGQAMAMACILMALCAGLLLLVDRPGARTAGWD